MIGSSTPSRAASSTCDGSGRRTLRHGGLAGEDVRGRTAERGSARAE